VGVARDRRVWETLLWVDVIGVKCRYDSNLDFGPGQMSSVNMAIQCRPCAFRFDCTPVALFDCARLFLLIDDG
jgi:hypothetical protein